MLMTASCNIQSNQSLRAHHVTNCFSLSNNAHNVTNCFSLSNNAHNVTNCFSLSNNAHNVTNCFSLSNNAHNVTNSFSLSNGEIWYNSFTAGQNANHREIFCIPQLELHFGSNSY